MTEKVIEKTREADENEFFFSFHENIGFSGEFERFRKYINNHSNVTIIKVGYESVEQIKSSRNFSGGSYNLVVTQKTKNE